MKRKKVTATDIANALNISQPSVSRAFHSNAPIAQSKRTKILKKSIELGYMREQAEKLLKGKEITRLAFIVGDMHNPFFSSLIRDFSNSFNSKDHYLLSIHILDNDYHEQMESFLASLKHEKIKGIFAASISPNSILPKLCEQLGIALVLINRPTKHPNVSAVACDNQESAYQVTKYLHQKGHTRFAFLMGQRGIATFEDRLAGVQEYLDHAKLSSLMVLQCQQKYHSAYQTLLKNQQFLKSQKITAIIGGNDLMALGALDALRHQLNLQVPNDVAVFGFDDIPMASWDSYQLSTIRQRTHLMSKEAVELMQFSLEQNIVGLRRLSQGEFVIRQSC